MRVIVENVILRSVIVNQIIDEAANYISEYDIFDHYLIGNAIFIFITLNSIPLFLTFPPTSALFETSKTTQ